MKKVFFIIPVLALLISSCKTSQVGSYSDDVYANPTEDLRLAKVAAAEKAKQQAAEKQKQEDERLAQQAKDDANPYYKDPQFNSDDYYDYQYASKVQRFNNPLPGAGYYDNYYTNSYSYNQNPNMYGTSIYSSYNYLMPSNQFNNYSNGLSIGLNYNSYGYNNGFNNYNNYGYNSLGYGYNSYGYNSFGYNSGYGYNPYGYSSFGYNPYYGYNPYSYGYNPYGYSNNGWGYYNGYDVNSAYSQMTNGPRGSNGGGNGGRPTSARMDIPQDLQPRDNPREQFVESVVQKQEATPRFTEISRPVRQNTDNGGNAYGGNINGSTGNAPNNGRSSFQNNPGAGGNANTTNSGTTNRNGGFWPTIFSGNNTAPDVKNGTDNGANNRKARNSERISGSYDNSNNNVPSSANRPSNDSPTFPAGGGNAGSGSSSPRGGGGNGGGGTSRPR